MTFKIYTLGCKVNAYESESLKERPLKEGFREAKGKAADVYFVNTCAVTNESAEGPSKSPFPFPFESRQEDLCQGMFEPDS